MPRKYKKKTERQKIIAKLDDVVRKLIRERDKNMCQRCRGKGTDVSHVVPRTNKVLRWDLKNLKLLCRRCHLYWWHKHPMDAWQWFQREFPYRADYLLERKNQVKKYSVIDLKELYEEIKDKKT